jgi:hypothetical protein
MEEVLRRAHLRSRKEANMEKRTVCVLEIPGGGTYGNLSGSRIERIQISQFQGELQRGAELRRSSGNSYTTITKSPHHIWLSHINS